MTIADQQTRRSCSPIHLGTAGGILLIAVIVLAGCGEGDESTGSTIATSSDTAKASTSSSPASSRANSGVVVVEDVLYRSSSDRDGAGSTVDIYVGDGSEGGPLVVLLHGLGRSGAGDPISDLGPLGEEIAKLGSTVFYFGWQTGGGPGRTRCRI